MLNLSYKFKNVTGNTNAVIESATIVINGNTIATISNVNIALEATNSTVFSITNTAVLDQLETLFLTLIALPFGIGCSYLTNWYFSIYGIDLSVVATGLESMGLAAVIYTYLPLEVYLNISLMTFVVSMLSGMIPARRALKINPAEAVKSA